MVTGAVPSVAVSRETLERLSAMAREAGRAILEHYHAGTVAETKVDRSPITAADRAAHRVILDYPARRSVNFISRRLFELKRSVEGVMTRRFSLYDREEIAAAFQAAEFEVAAEQPQFLLPMALYRLAGSAQLARLAEWPGRMTGLTRVLGSPVIVRADRRPPG